MVAPLGLQVLRGLASGRLVWWRPRQGKLPRCTPCSAVEGFPQGFGAGPVPTSRLMWSSPSRLPCSRGHLCGRVLSMNLGSDGRSVACGKSQDGDQACENFEWGKRLWFNPQGGCFHRDNEEQGGPVTPVGLEVWPETTVLSSAC